MSWQLLTGAHTIGFAHCDQFRDRLYNFNGTSQMDPSLNATLAEALQKKCPPANEDEDAATIVPFDATSPLQFDVAYYVGLQTGQGLLFSDQVLFADASTQATVKQLASSQQLFFDQFSQSMIKLTSVVSNQTGNIRKHCSAFNDEAS
ncbi:hypothetical protein GOP47_0002420 [Adiantum capillus-veneris]|uniref:Plant heme peroxidase family profile domain-containing protein n=1 Tax=Adiantum capillus-veneris TaxID=13818 RepID=A0A9D4VC21_ADICA|nr:hypothetical protein GOP47_0002420 [Adiantum capillus-veneris]